MADNYSGAMTGGAIGGSPRITAAIQGSRIHSDVERVLSLARAVHSARDRVQRQTAALGYFSEAPPEATDNNKIQPISNNLQSALNVLERSLDGLNSALNLFD